MSLYVKCTLEHYDTTSVKHFSGVLRVDSNERSLKIIGSLDEHKFYAHEFTPLGGPPSKSTAKQFWLDFDLSKQHSGRHQIRKRKLVFRTTELSHNIRDVYEEVKKIFPRKSSPVQVINGVRSPPVGVLRSRPDVRISCMYRGSERHQNELAGTLLSSKTELRERWDENKPKQAANVENWTHKQTSTKSENLSNIDSTSHPSKNHVKESGISVCSGHENSRSSGTHLNTNCEEASCLLNERKDLSSDSVTYSKNPAEKLAVESREDCKEKLSSTSGLSQGSVITFIEKKNAESSSIKVSASFKAYSHTATFRSKRNDRSPPSSSSAKKPAHDPSQTQFNNCQANDPNDLYFPSFYGTSRTMPLNQLQCSRRSDEIVSPRPQLLADSVSSPRCLLSPKHASDWESSPFQTRDTTLRRGKKNSDEYLGKPDTTGPHCFSSALSESTSPYSYRGLENLTNSCYMNATLQALATVFPFYYRMQMIQHRREQPGHKCSEFVRRFSDVLRNLVSPDRPVDSLYGTATNISVLEALRTAAGKELGSDPDFGSNMQQDAHEFLAKTLEILEKESIRYKLNGTHMDSFAARTKLKSDEGSSSLNFLSTNPAGVFQHRIRDRFGCERCARSSEMTNNAIDLTVTVSAGESIQKMIENALAREEIEYKCEHCGSGPGFICRAFAALPQSLIIVVKRYRFGEAGGSKVEEKIGVSRELFLKDLYVDSDVKRREGIAKRSFSQSPASSISETRRNSRTEDSSFASEMSSETYHSFKTSQQEESFQCFSEKSSVDDCVVPETSCSSGDSNGSEPNYCQKFEDPNKAIESPPSVGSSRIAGLDFRNSIASSELRNMSSFAELNSSAQRIVLSPLKINRVTPLRNKLLVESFESPRKLVEVEEVVASSPGGPHGMLSYPEKENVAISSMSALCTAVEGGVTKQTGGYVKESSFEEKCEIVEGSRECREYEDPNTTELVDNQLDCTNVTDTEDISRTIFSENGSNDVKAVVSSEHSKHCDNNGIYARQITEPLRPLNTSAPSTRLPQDVGVESVAVVGEHEEQITLFFRPVQEELQKKWCLRFGLQYVGTPDLRKHTFGRELEFSLRDTPQSCEVRGDGNCLFRTLCWWITGGSEIHHFLLREKLISFMSKYRSKFTSFLQSQQDMDNHLLRMSEDGEWGTQVELAAAACWLGVNIYTFLEGKWLKYRPLFRWSNDGSAPVSLKLDDCNDDKGAIFICNASGCHFQPAVSIERHFARRSLRSRKEKDLIKDSAYLSLITEPPYVFNSADGPVYSLSAVICHHGDSLLSGHYSTFALDVARQEWLDCNDNIITKSFQELFMQSFLYYQFSESHAFKVSEAEVMDNSSSSGYIFIYNRLEDPYSRL